MFRLLRSTAGEALAARVSAPGGAGIAHDFSTNAVDRLNDILEAIAKIEERATDCFETFQADQLLQVWVIHHLQVIGEAARGLSQDPDRSS